MSQAGKLDRAQVHRMQDPADEKFMSDFRKFVRHLNSRDFPGPIAGGMLAATATVNPLDQTLETPAERIEQQFGRGATSDGHAILEIFRILNITDYDWDGRAIGFNPAHEGQDQAVQERLTQHAAAQMDAPFVTEVLDWTVSQTAEGQQAQPRFQYEITYQRTARPAPNHLFQGRLAIVSAGLPPTFEPPQPNEE